MKPMKIQPSTGLLVSLTSLALLGGCGSSRATPGDAGTTSDGSSPGEPDGFSRHV